MGETGCFRGPAESRALASGGLLKLGRGQEQLRARCGTSLGNRLPPAHFWQTPGHRAGQSRASQSVLAPQKDWGEGNGHWGWQRGCVADHFLAPAPPRSLHGFLLLTPTALGSWTSVVCTDRGWEVIGNSPPPPSPPRPCPKTDNLKALSPCP